MQDRWLLSLALSALALPAFAAPSADWPQFRGPGGNAVSETAFPPVTFGAVHQPPLEDNDTPLVILRRLSSGGSDLSHQP